MSVESLLDEVAGLLERGDLSAAASAVRVAWREEPVAELAELLERFPGAAARPPEDLPSTALMERWLARWPSAGPLEVPALLDELDHLLRTQMAKFVTPCFDALAASAPDPRVGRRCVRWLSSVDDVRNPIRGLFKMVQSALWKHLDPRDADAIARLADEGSPWRHAAGIILGGRFRQMQTVADRRVSVALAPPLQARFAQLGSLAAAAKPPPPREDGKPRSEDEFLAQLRASPRDPALRAVFADWLIERGDPWGELIALAENRLRTASAVTPRERSLLKQARPRILGGLADVKKSVLDDLVFERGFLTGASVKLKGVTRVAALLSRPEFATLERVRFALDAAITPNLLALREAHGLSRESVVAAQKKAPGVQLEVVTLEAPSGISGLSELEWWPSLRELYVARAATMGLRGRAEELRWLFALPITKHLRATGLTDLWALHAFEGWSWDALEKAPIGIDTVRLEVLGGLSATFSFHRLEDGWRLEVRALEVERVRRSPYVEQVNLEGVKRIGQLLADARERVLDPALPAEVQAALRVR